MVKEGDENENVEELKDNPLYRYRAYCCMFSFIAGESPTDSSKRCYYDDVLASYVFGLYDAIGPLKINLSKEREKYVWDYCKIIYSACTSLVIDLYNWSLASNSWFFD